MDRGQEGTSRISSTCSFLSCRNPTYPPCTSARFEQCYDCCPVHQEGRRDRPYEAPATQVVRMARQRPLLIGPWCQCRRDEPEECVRGRYRESQVSWMWADVPRRTRPRM